MTCQCPCPTENIYKSCRRQVVDTMPVPFHLTKNWREITRVMNYDAAPYCVNRMFHFALQEVTKPFYREIDKRKLDVYNSVILVLQTFLR